MILKLLHKCSPETAHWLTLLGLSLGLGPRQKAAGKGPLLFGKLLPGHVGLSGGADKNAEALGGWRHMGFAFVELGTVTKDARKGNPGPRIWRMKDGRSLVNWMGLPNQGVNSVARNLTSYRASAGKEFCVGVSLATPGGKVAELGEMASRFAVDADFFTLNASCPNVSDHEAEGALSGVIAQLESAISGAAGRPVLVKLAPTTDDESLRTTVRHLASHGAAGFIACNTLPYASSNLAEQGTLPRQWPQHDGQPVGGYSGPALLSISKRMVRVIRAELGKDKVVIGVGGIQSVDDAKTMLAAGADAVQLYTALTYQGPKLLKTLNEALG